VVTVLWSIAARSVPLNHATPIRRIAASSVELRRLYRVISAIARFARELAEDPLFLPRRIVLAERMPRHATGKQTEAAIGTLRRDRPDL
jgi:hypothetical protein